MQKKQQHEKRNDHVATMPTNSLTQMATEPVEQPTEKRVSILTSLVHSISNTKKVRNTYETLTTLRIAFFVNN